MYGIGILALICYCYATERKVGAWCILLSLIILLMEFVLIRVILFDCRCRKYYKRKRKNEA